MCQPARGPDADRHAKLLIHLAVAGSLLGAYSHVGHRDGYGGGYQNVFHAGQSNEKSPTPHSAEPLLGG